MLYVVSRPPIWSMEPLTCNYSDGVLSLPQTHKNINSRNHPVYQLGLYTTIVLWRRNKDGTKDAATCTEDTTSCDHSSTASWWWLAGRRGCQPSPRPAVQYFTATLETRRFPPVIYNIHTRHYPHWAAHTPSCSLPSFTFLPHIIRRVVSPAPPPPAEPHTVLPELWPADGRHWGMELLLTGPDVSNAVIWSAVFAISCIICLDIINM